MTTALVGSSIRGKVGNLSILALPVFSALLGLLSVAALLAWVFGLGSFARWFWLVSAPAMAVLGLVGLLVSRRLRYSRLHTALAAGALGGLVGTLGYDLFRLPFLALGLRLFAPIDSYGLLLLDADSSSSWTGLAGWSYHFLNGIGFGVAYGVLALGRRWWWGIVWGMVLETATIVTPYAKEYGISEHWELISLAYLAHVAYGAPLGLIVQHGHRIVAALYDVSTRPVPWTLASLGVGLMLWHQPFASSKDIKTAEATEPAAFIDGGRFKPEWLRVAPRGCIVLLNNDQRTHQLETPFSTPMISAQGRQTVCFPRPGVLRVRIDGEPYSGGFVIVDDKARP